MRRTLLFGASLYTRPKAIQLRTSSIQPSQEFRPNCCATTCASETSITSMACARNEECHEAKEDGVSARTVFSGQLVVTAVCPRYLCMCQLRCAMQTCLKRMSGSASFGNPDAHSPTPTFSHLFQQLSAQRRDLRGMTQLLVSLVMDASWHINIIPKSI